MEDKIFVRDLNTLDAYAIQEIEKKSGAYLEDWLDIENFVFGIFKNDTLIGHCSIGYADDISQNIDNYPGKTADSLLLGNVYILPEHRNKGYGSLMLKEAIRFRHEYDKYNELVFCQPLHEGLYTFYENLGFVRISDGDTLGDMVIPLEKDKNHTCLENNYNKTFQLNEKETEYIDL